MRETRQLGRLSFRPIDTNVNQGQNILAIVAETVTSGGHPVRLEHTSRAELKNGLDGKTDSPLNDQGDHPLTRFLLADFMVIDISKPFR